MEATSTLTLTIGDCTFKYESNHKYLDSSTLVQAFAGLMQAHTYDIDTIIDSMETYIKDYKIHYDESKG